MSDLYTTQERVEMLLSKYIEARNDDRFLIAAFMKHWCNIRTFKEYYLDKTAPTTESIRRVRQKIQANNLYLPTKKEVRAKRNIAEEIYREYALSSIEPT